MIDKKSCDTCVSRLICPNNYRVCAGWNDEELFWGLVKLHFPFQDEFIDKKREFIKKSQRCNKNEELKPYVNDNQLETCKMCYNSRLDDDLTDDNDLSYSTLCVNKEYRVMYASGWGKPPRLEFEFWDNDYWSTVLIYYPKYCPNCGRAILEYSDDNNS